MLLKFSQTLVSKVVNVVVAVVVVVVAVVVVASNEAATQHNTCTTESFFFLLRCCYFPTFKKVFKQNIFLLLFDSKSKKNFLPGLLSATLDVQLKTKILVVPRW